MAEHSTTPTPAKILAPEADKAAAAETIKPSHVAPDVRRGLRNGQFADPKIDRGASTVIFVGKSVQEISLAPEQFKSKAELFVYPNDRAGQYSLMFPGGQTATLTAGPNHLRINGKDTHVILYQHSGYEDNRSMNQISIYVNNEKIAHTEMGSRCKVNIKSLDDQRDPAQASAGLLNLRRNDPRSGITQTFSNSNGDNVTLLPGQTLGIFTMPDGNRVFLRHGVNNSVNIDGKQHNLMLNVSYDPTIGTQAAFYIDGKKVETVQVNKAPEKVKLPK